MNSCLFGYIIFTRTLPLLNQYCCFSIIFVLFAFCKFIMFTTQYSAHTQSVTLTSCNFAESVT